MQAAVLVKMLAAQLWVLLQRMLSTTIAARAEADALHPWMMIGARGTIAAIDPDTAAAAVRRRIRERRPWPASASVLQHLLVLLPWLGRSHRATETVDEAARAIAVTRPLAARK